MGKTFQIYNEWICCATDQLMDLGTPLKQWKDLYVSGLAYVDGFGEDFAMNGFDITSMGAIYGSNNVYIDMSASGGYLDLVANESGANGVRIFGDTAITGTLHATGYYLNVTTVTDDYIILLTDDVILCDSQSGNATYTVTLPSALSCNGKILIIKTMDIGSAETITIEAQSGEVIDNGNTIELTADYTAYRLISDGNDWYLI